MFNVVVVDDNDEEGKEHERMLRQANLTTPT